MADHGRNGFDGKQVGEFLARIDECDDELATLQGEYRNACKGPRASIKNVKQLAHEAGLNPVAFNEALALHREDRRAEKRRLGMEQDDAADLEAMLDALGPFADTDLGQAAVAAKDTKRQHDEAALDGLGRGK